MVDAYTNDAIIAIKAPVTAADETAVLAVADRVADFYDYQELLGCMKDRHTNIRYMIAC